MIELQSLRTNIRRNAKFIIDHLSDQYIVRGNGKKNNPISSICMFCGSNKDLTREHVIPKWAFERKTDKFFLTNINGLPHTYNKTTIPACIKCNSVLLNELEKHVLRIFSNHNLPDSYFSDEELEQLIRWIEILDYKLQVFSLITKFRASKKNGHIPFLADHSISVLDPNIDYSPAKVISGLRSSLKRILIKSKSGQMNSLVIFKTRNKEFGFFHKNNDYLFLELPQKQVAVFYFFKKMFADVIEARDQALSIIKEQYKDGTAS
jgi:hypothetical protein